MLTQGPRTRREGGMPADGRPRFLIVRANGRGGQRGVYEVPRQCVDPCYTLSVRGLCEPNVHPAVLVSHYTATKTRLPRPPTSTLPFPAVANLDLLVVASTLPFIRIGFRIIHSLLGLPVFFSWLFPGMRSGPIDVISRSGNARCRVPTIRAGSRPFAHSSPSRFLLSAFPPAHIPPLPG